MKTRFLLTFLMLFIFTGTVFAQGVQTATLTGTVTGPDGKPLPGVTVTAKSPNQMGERTTVTSSTGDYNLPGLAPGDYTITYSLEGMSAQTRKQNLVLGVPTRIDEQMKVSSVTEAITVTPTRDCGREAVRIARRDASREAARGWRSATRCQTQGDPRFPRRS